MKMTINLPEQQKWGQKIRPGWSLIGGAFLILAFSMSQALQALAAPPPGIPPNDNSLLAKISALESTVAAQQIAIQTLTEQVAYLNSQVSGLGSDVTDLTDAVADLEASPVMDLADYVKVVDYSISDLQGPHIFFYGANVHITKAEEFIFPDEKNGLGNLIIGWNSGSTSGPLDRSGSHNLIVGPTHSYSGLYGVAFGRSHIISGTEATALGGADNEATGDWSVAVGGSGNTAPAQYAVVTGGSGNDATGPGAVITGGISNEASGEAAVVSGGASNVASGDSSVVSGGFVNQATGDSSTVSGGYNNTASGQFDHLP